jgi:hypothetical protein
MQQQPNQAAEDDARHEWGVLCRLLSNDGLWTVDEIVRSQGDAQTTRLDTIDAIKHLEAEGLIYRTSDDVIFPTRAALYFDQIAA